MTHPIPNMNLGPQIVLPRPYINLGLTISHPKHLINLDPLMTQPMPHINLGLTMAQPMAIINNRRNSSGIGGINDNNNANAAVARPRVAPVTET